MTHCIEKAELCNRNGDILDFPQSPGPHSAFFSGGVWMEGSSLAGDNCRLLVHATKKK